MHYKSKHINTAYARADWGVFHHAITDILDKSTPIIFTS